MKKFLLLGACVASIAVSSSALAAVTYGDESNLAVEVNSTETAVSVTSGLPTEASSNCTCSKGK